MNNKVIANNERKEHIITWFIENYSYCCQKNWGKLLSPRFTSEGLEGTVWNLMLLLKEDSEENGYNISLFLDRWKKDDGPEDFLLKFELSILASDESVLVSKQLEYTFRRGIGYGMPQFIKIDEVLLYQKAHFLINDTLCVRCKIWRGEGEVQSVTQFKAVTRIGIERMSFLHVVENFSTLKPHEKNTIQVISPSDNELVISSNIYFCDDSCCKGKIIVGITTSCSELSLTKCKLSLLDKFGKVIECSKADCRFNPTSADIQKLPLSLTRTVILNRKDKYLLDDKLSLLCQCTFTFDIELEKIEKTMHQIPLVAAHQINYEDTYNIKKKLSACPSVLDDLKEIYNNLFLTDIELKTETKSFPAHKFVLCARSSVSKAMLTVDMKEKSRNCIQMEDIENDTVQELLLFLYSDNLENLQWESAIKLYYVGDKYAIEKLKMLCSSFLIDNLSTSNATELLLLADSHNDLDLKTFVEDFILEHDQEVFGSDEWENLIEINPLLVIKTMHLKYKRKNEM
ncbi:Speckle-type POZ protein like [Argiope bruennichi]|uniref:Speckle-type POZ protein like n=1 Tax=Argiope bruennichi TaxID=94029 RepID=A0A8T0EP28_ARGBR|nr:Speckle-type POZ protein like [Argiope bruennichi]